MREKKMTVNLPNTFLVSTKQRVRSQKVRSACISFHYSSFNFSVGMGRLIILNVVIQKKTLSHYAKKPISDIKATGINLWSEKKLQNSSNI